MNVAIGTLGENLSVTTDGEPMQESNVCIGDVYHFGTLDSPTATRLKIVQPRRPCYKINDQLKHYDIAKFISLNGISGWYFQVVQDGNLSQGLPVYLVERPYLFADLTSLWQFTNQKEKILATIANQWLGVDCLEFSWKECFYTKSL